MEYKQCSNSSPQLSSRFTYISKRKLKSKKKPFSRRIRKFSPFSRRSPRSRAGSARADKPRVLANKRIQLIPDQDMFKMVGGVLIKMDKMEVETELNGRIGFLEKSLKNLMDKIQEAQKKGLEARENLLRIDKEFQ